MQAGVHVHVTDTAQVQAWVWNTNTVHWTHARAQDTFRIGVFSSASQRTVEAVIPMLEAAATCQEGPSEEGNGSAEGPHGNGAAGGKKRRRLLQQRLFVLARQHTEAAPQVRRIGVIARSAFCLLCLIKACCCSPAQEAATESKSG